MYIYVFFFLRGHVFISSARGKPGCEAVTTGTLSWFFFMYGLEIQFVSHADNSSDFIDDTPIIHFQRPPVVNGKQDRFSAWYSKGEEINLGIATPYD